LKGESRPAYHSGNLESRTLSRTAENVVAAPYVVLDFDGLDGLNPKTSTEIEAHSGPGARLIWNSGVSADE
jgi:hypothetical protein